MSTVCTACSSSFGPTTRIRTDRGYEARIMTLATYRPPAASETTCPMRALAAGSDGTDRSRRSDADPVPTSGFSVPAFVMAGGGDADPVPQSGLSVAALMMAGGSATTSHCAGPCSKLRSRSISPGRSMTCPDAPGLADALGREVGEAGADGEG